MMPSRKMHFLKKTSALLLAAAVSASSVGVTAFAATRTDPQYIDVYVTTDSQAFLDSHMELIEAIANGLFQHQSSVNIASYHCTVGDFEAVQNAIIAKYPELFFLHKEYPFSYSYDPKSNSDVNLCEIISITPKYLYSKEDTDTMLEEFYNAADFYLNQVKNELSVCTDDFSKAALLHDEIVLDARYVKERSTYNFMVNKYGLCYDYTAVYAYLLSQIGISSEIVKSAVLDHAWLKTKLDGQYYNVDITWDDPLITDNSDTSVSHDMPGRAGHEYYLLSDSVLQNGTSSVTAHGSYSTVYPADDTRYDGALLHNYESKLCKVDAGETAFYAVDRQNKAIVRYNYADNTEETILPINYSWSVKGKPGHSWTEGYISLDTYKGMLYYNTPNGIYMLDPQTNKQTELLFTAFEDDYYLYGLRIRDGKLYEILSQAPDSAYTEQAVMDLSHTVTFDPANGEEPTQLEQLTGLPVTQPDEVPVRPGYVFKGWLQNDSAYNFNQPVSEDITLTADWEASASIKGASLTLDGKIGINFYVYLPEGSISSGMKAVMSGVEGNTEVTVNEECLTNQENVYQFTYRLSSKDLDDAVTLHFEDTQGQTQSLIYYQTGAPVDNNTYSYAIEDYIQTVQDGTYTDELKALVNALQDFGSYSALYFDGVPVGTVHADDLNAITADSLSDKKVSISGEDADITLSGFSLVLDSETTIKLYFKARILLEGKNLTCDEGTLQADNYNGQNGYFVRLDNISAQQLDKTYTVKIGGYTIQCSALSYAYATLYQNKDEVMMNVVKAMTVYSHAAHAYFNSNEGA